MGTTLRLHASDADCRAPRRRPGLAEREKERYAEDDDAERRACDRGQLRARIPGLVGRRELDEAHRWENKGERGRRSSTCDLEHDAEVAGNEGNW